MPQEEVFRTKNIKHSAFLKITPGIRFTGVEKDGRDAVFVFSPRDKVKTAMDQYFIEETRVNPKALFESFESLKDLIFYNQSQRDGEPTSTEVVHFKTGERGGS